MIPLVNVPLIDYTIELLAGADVKEIFIFCGGGTKGQQVMEHVRASRWNKSVKLHYIEGDKSVGDCLRECDDMRTDGKINEKGDLIVVTGPVVANYELAAVLAKHKAHKKRDKASILTCSLKRLSQVR